MALYLEGLQIVKFVFQQIKITYALPQIHDGNFNSESLLFLHRPVSTLAPVHWESMQT